MDAVLKETLRLYPATVGMVPRTAVQDVILDGYPIPRGVSPFTFSINVLPSG